VEVIPSIDLRGGQIVRLEQGDYERETVFERDPAAPATRFVEAGATRIHVVDLEGAREGTPRNLPAVKAILAAAGRVPVQVGGGVRDLERIETLLELGADRVILGTAVVEAPELVHDAASRHPGRVVLGLDARDGRVAIRGWRETGSREVADVLHQFEGLPLAAVLHTDVGRDGMLGGPNVDSTERLARVTSLPVLASGGVGSVEDLLRLARTRVIAGAVVGRAIYSGAIDLAAAIEAVASC
jgi:phosphoribosylformimino-5-aminoimidazole carboxamide ribotide isomerase